MNDNLLELAERIGDHTMISELHALKSLPKSQQIPTGASRDYWRRLYAGELTRDELREWYDRQPAEWRKRNPRP